MLSAVRHWSVRHVHAPPSVSLSSAAVLKSRMARRLSRFRLQRPVARSLLCRAFHLEQRTRISRGVALLRHMND